jgi:hypothetical protein
MSKYPLPKLWSLWQQERLKAEQAIGQILQHLLAQEKQIKELKRLLAKSPPGKGS